MKTKFVLYTVAFFLLTSLFCQKKKAITEYSTLLSYQTITISEIQFLDFYYPFIAFRGEIDSDSTRLAKLKDLFKLYWYASKYNGKGVDTVYDLKYLSYRQGMILKEHFHRSILQTIPDADESQLRGLFLKQNFQFRITWVESQDSSQIALYHQEIMQGLKFDSLPGVTVSDPLQWGVLPPLLDEAVFSLKPGEYCAPLRTLSGWYLIQLKEINQNPLITEEDFNKHKEKLAKQWKNFEAQKKSELFLLEKLAGKEIITHPEVMPKIREFITLMQVTDPALREKERENAMFGTNLQKLMDESNVPLAEMAGMTLTMRDFMINYLNIPKSTRNGPIAQTIQQVLRDEYLIRESIRLGYDQNPYVQQLLQNYHIFYGANMIQHQLKENVNPSIDDYQTYYESHQNQFIDSLHYKGYVYHVTNKQKSVDFYEQYQSDLVNAGSQMIFLDTTIKLESHIDPASTIFLITRSYHQLKSEQLNPPITWNKGFTIFYPLLMETVSKRLENIKAQTEELVFREKMKSLIADSLEYDIEWDRVNIDMEKLKTLDFKKYR